MTREKPLILLMNICIAIRELWGVEAEEPAVEFHEIIIIRLHFRLPHRQKFEKEAA